MRLSRTTTSPRSMTSAPFIVTSRALRSTATPVGLSFRTAMTTSSRAGSYAGRARALSERATCAESPGARAVVTRRTESARVVESRTRESARARSYVK
jgi:hypothetical protein